MNKTEKLLQKLNASTRGQIEMALLRLYAGELEGLDIKKIKGSTEIYRLRVGKYRVIYKQLNGRNELVEISLRNEKTYKNL